MIGVSPWHSGPKKPRCVIQTIRERRGERGHHFTQPECVWCLLLPGLISLCRNRSPLCFPCPVFCFLHYFSLLDDYKRQGICFQSQREPTKPNGNNTHPHKTQNKPRKGGNTLHWIFREQEFDVDVWGRQSHSYLLFFFSHSIPSPSLFVGRII